MLCVAASRPCVTVIFSLNPNNACMPWMAQQPCVAANRPSLTVASARGDVLRTLDRYNADRLVLIADQVVTYYHLRGALMSRTAHPLLLLLAILFILSACASGNTPASAPTAAPATAPTQAPAANANAPTQAPVATDSKPVPASGSLIGMEVVIEAPPEMAGVTTLESLKIVSIAGFAMCSSTPSADPFIVTFIAPPGQDPPTSVATFSLSVSGGVTVNQPTPATFEVGLGRSDNPQMFAGEGTVVVAPDGRSGTFETTRLKGRWSCTFAD